MSSVGRVGLVGLVGLVLATLVSACGVRTPSRIDVTTMVKSRGELEVRRDLAVRIVADPKDVAARLALATLEDRAGHPSGAIEQLEAVAALSGPLGTRWHDDDRERLARLLAARGRARLAREVPTALSDLTRAGELGAKIEARELVNAKVLIAIAQLRHVDAKERAKGKHSLAGLWMVGGAEPAWAGARDGATIEEHGAFGVWLWRLGAKRAAWEELRAWHDASHAPRDQTPASAYLSARVWWIPTDGPPPDAEDLVGPDRCRFARTCSAAYVAAADDADLRAALLLSPRSRDAEDVTAWMTITMIEALRGEVSWGPTLAARVDLSSTPIDNVRPALRPTFAVLAGRLPPSEAGDPPRTVPERLLVAAGRALRGASFEAVSAPLRDPAAAKSELVPVLLRVARSETEVIDRPFSTALLAHVAVRVPNGVDGATLRRVVEGYRRDPAIADRLARDVVAESIDAATAHASLGAMFDALGDPARARAAWQAAVDSSAELANLYGLAESTARAKDPDAAMVAATTAAAASGDPAVVWVRVARSLERTGEHVHALEATRNAIGLASGRALLDAYDIAIEASRSLHRTGQVDELTAARDRIAPLPAERPSDPTDAASALVDYRRNPTVSALARLWVAARWNRRDVAARATLLAAISVDDPRRASIIADLVALARDPDPDVGRDAVAALR